MERPKDLNQISCGCCSAGCRCFTHMDLPWGQKPKVCSYHATLPYAPADRLWRYDAAIGQYVRIPQGVERNDPRA
jgi:hypothetical protein